MPSRGQHLISVFRTIVMAGVTALLILPVVLPMQAQNSVPPTAVQAAKSPQFASRLAHPAARPLSTPKPAVRRPASRKVPGGGNEIYDNGPINGNVDAWTINFGFIVSDTFTTMNTSVTGMSFGAWLFPGDTLTSAQLSITSGPNGGTSYFDQTVNFSQGACTVNEFGFNVCTVSTSFNGPTLNQGTYWVNLQNASVPSGDPAYWDENSGDGCESSGCPSQAEQNNVGTIPSEAFSMLGMPNCESRAQEKPATAAKAVTVPPSPTQTYRVIYNFTGGADGAVPTAGLAIDAAGNLYGTTIGGPDGRGTVFKLTPHGSSWTFSRLYLFSGANGFSPDSNPVLGADGRLYGTTELGGVGQGYGNGVLFGLSPAGNVLPTPFSNWLESLLYDFTAGSDGASPGGSLVLDSSGNIYGNAAAAGANHGGTLYEFTSGGLQVLHSFPAFQGDGRTPIGVAQGSDGLYGITASGGQYNGGVIYTTAGGYQVLHSFMPDGPDGNPTSLTVDQAGNLYGAANYTYYTCVAPGGYEPVGNAQIFQVSPPDWNPSLLISLQQIFTSLSARVTTDASGNLYGTIDNLNDYGNVFKLTCCWNYTDLHDFAGPPNDGQQPLASPVVDAQGNIYGTTSYGGAYGQGVVWEISP